MNMTILDQARRLFREYYRCDPVHAAYAPGRVEILGNHTDYNDGYVLSSAIGQGTWFLAAPAPDTECRIVAGDVREQEVFPAKAPQADPKTSWADYIKGVWVGLTAEAAPANGFWGLFLGNVPLGAGLSSSAALEISAGLALAALCKREVSALELARIGQMAEHRYAGVQCGLLDQITSLFGQQDRLVKTDFRDLTVETIAAGDRLRFLIVNTGVKHRLVDSEYNRRREECRRAANHFARALPEREISALRDVRSSDWEKHHAGLDEVAARRALHVIGENERVLEGAALLRNGDLAGFGRLMFASHESSRVNFENSCAELDDVVAIARDTDGVMGARLSGGGFGGGAVLLVDTELLDSVAQNVSAAYNHNHNSACQMLPVRPAMGARIIN